MISTKVQFIEHMSTYCDNIPQQQGMLKYRVSCHNGIRIYTGKIETVKRL